MFIVVCPHCRDPIIIEQINCAIFRHGADKNYHQIPPHASREICVKLTKFGCGKPFKIIRKNKDYEAIECEYI